MKLKILLVPVCVVVSLVLIIGYIYPAWFGEDANSIKNIKIEIDKRTKELNTVKTKKDNAAKLTQSLSGNEEIESLINKYYSNYRNEEDVVSNVNNIAFSEGVFLKDMKVEYKKIESSDDPVRLMSLPVLADSPSPSVLEGVNLTVPVLDESGNSLGDVAKSKIRFIEISLKISGNYEQIKRFTTSLNRVGLLNNIQSFEIYKEKGENGSGDADAKETQTADLLSADIVTGFGYMVYSSKDIDTLLNSSVLQMDRFNFEEAEKYRADLTGSYKPSEIGETGNQNPFLSTPLVAQ